MDLWQFCLHMWRQNCHKSISSPEWEFLYPYDVIIVLVFIQVLAVIPHDDYKDVNCILYQWITQMCDHMICKDVDCILYQWITEMYDHMSWSEQNLSKCWQYLWALEPLESMCTFKEYPLCSAIGLPSANMEPWPGRIALFVGQNSQLGLWYRKVSMLTGGTSLMASKLLSRL